MPRSSDLASGFYSVGVTAVASPTDSAVERSPLPPSLAFLEQLSMDLVVTSDRATHKRYALTVHHARTKASWRRVHSFAAFTAFQQRMLARLERGHFCMAECPWLVSFLERRFPRPLLFRFRSPRVMEERRRLLLDALKTLQLVLLNPLNRCCEILTEHVATEFVAFLYGDTDPENSSSANQSSSNQRSTAATTAVPTTSQAARPWELVSPKACERMDCSDRDWHDTRHFSDDDDDAPLSQRSDQSSLQVFPPSCGNGMRKQRSSSSADTTLLSQFEETPRSGAQLSLDGGLLSPLPESALANFSPQSIPENAVLSPQDTSAVHFAQRERVLRQRSGSSSNNNNNNNGSSAHSGWRVLSLSKSPLQHLSTVSVLRSFRRRCSRSTATTTAS